MERKSPFPQKDRPVPNEAVDVAPSMVGETNEGS